MHSEKHTHTHTYKHTHTHTPPHTTSEVKFSICTIVFGYYISLVYLTYYRF